MSFENEIINSDNVLVKRDHFKLIIYDLIRTHSEYGFKNRKSNVIKNISQSILGNYYSDIVNEVFKESKDKNLLMDNDDKDLIDTIDNLMSNFLQTDTEKLSKIMETVFEIKGKENNDAKRAILTDLIPMVNDRMKFGELITEKNKRGLS